MKDTNAIKDKSEQFAIRIVNLYKYLYNNQEFVMSKQLLRSGTSIGANVAEIEFAASRSDFLNKLYIALKECGETHYWLNLLYKTEYITDRQYNSIVTDCQEIKRLLISATKTLAEK